MKNCAIGLRLDKFQNSGGIFNLVHNGATMDLVYRFVTRGQVISQNDILYLLESQDELGRTPIVIASYLNFKNIALYLAIKQGDPDKYLSMELNVDKEGRTYYHSVCYRGNYEVLTTLLNYERACLKKVVSDMLQYAKNQSKFKNLDIKHGELVSTVYHD